MGGGGGEGGEGKLDAGEVEVAKNEAAVGVLVPLTKPSPSTASILFARFVSHVEPEFVNIVVEA